MRFLFFYLACACVVGAAACGSSPSNETSSTDPNDPKHSSALDGGDSSIPSTHEPPPGGGSDPGFPGDPSSGQAAPIVVTINGMVRVFDGEAGWSKSFPDGGTLVGFDTNAHDGKDWTLVLSVFGTAPGAYACTGSGVPHAGLGVTNQLKSDGGFDPSGIFYGGSEGTDDCTVTLASYGPKKGDHVTGTFRGVLHLSNGFGQTTVDTLTLTNGSFDLVQFDDTPP